jgi:hypothetical protein
MYKKILFAPIGLCPKQIISRDFIIYTRTRFDCMQGMKSITQQEFVCRNVLFYIRKIHYYHDPEGSRTGGIQIPSLTGILFNVDAMAGTKMAFLTRNENNV